MSMMQEDKFRNEKQARISEMRFEQFVKRWAPKDRYEASEFHAQLHTLMMYTWRDAQEPLIKQVTAMMAAIPMIPIIQSDKA